MKPRQFAHRLLSGSCLVISLACSLVAVQAATLSWDADELFNNGTLGGTSTWDTTLLNWDDGAADVAWTTNLITGDTALFAGTAGTVTLGSAINALGLQFTTTGYTIATGANTLTLGSGGIDAGALSSGTTTLTGLVALGAGQSWNVGSGATLTSSAAISGANALEKTGAGTLILGVANTYSGGTTISAGTLQITNAAGFGTNTVAIGGTGTANLSLGTAVTVANAFSGAGTITASNLGGGGANTLALSGNLSGFTGTLNVGTGGTGKLSFSNATQGNVMSSSATINVAANGTLYVFNPLNYGSSLFLNGGTTGEALGQLRIEGGSTWSGNITLNANTTIGGNTTAGTISGVISGSGTGFTKLGSGTLILTNTNTYTGGTTLSAGTLQLGNGSTTGSISASSAITATAASTLAINRSNAVAQGTDFGNLNSTNITLNQLGTGSLTLTGNNTIKTLNINNATGTVDIGAGNLTINNAGADTIRSTTGGTINATGGGAIVLGASDGDTGTASGTTLTINAKITSGAGVRLEYWNGAVGNTGTLVLTNAANDYTGGTAINTDGTISVSTINNTGFAGNLGTGGTISLARNAATLKYTGAGETTNRTITMSGGANTGGTIDASGTGTALRLSNVTNTNTANGTATLTLMGTGLGEITGSLVNQSGTRFTNVTKTGTGAWTLSGAGSTYGGGTRANGGTLIISGSVVNSGSFVSVNNVGATNATLKVLSGATLGMSDFNMGEAANSRAAVFQSGGAITVNQNAGNAFRLGNNTNSYGYYNMSGGTLDLVGAAGEFNVGGGAAAGQSAVGVMDVSGTAAITTKSWILLGRGDAGNNVSTSSGLLNITGGSISHTSNQIGMGWAEASGATSIINVGGGAGTAALTGYNSASLGDTGINLARTSITGQLGAVNLLANGTLTVSNVQASGANTETLLNFNGGTLKATATNAGTSFLTAANLDAVHVYSGGGTINNNGTAITIGRALLTNSGTGITNIAVTNGGSGYIGAPLVEISGGTGFTGTAYANMVDDGTGNGTFKIGSITVTSNGVYSVAPTTVTLTGGGATTAATIGAISTGANVTTGGMTFTGTGTTTLGGANTYTGATSINAGTLAINGSVTSSVTVNNTGTLGGTGTITGDLTVKSGGTHAAGNSPGLQTVSGNATYESGSIFSWDLAANLDGDLSDGGDTGTRGTNYDAVNVGGNLSVDSGAVFRVIQNGGLDFNDNFWDSAQVWSDIFSVTGTTTSNWLNTVVSVYDTVGGPVDVSAYGGFTITGTSLSWSAVPEPTTAMAGLLLGAGLLRRKRSGSPL